MEDEDILSSTKYESQPGLAWRGRLATKIAVLSDKMDDKMLRGNSAIANRMSHFINVEGATLCILCSIQMKIFQVYNI